MRALLDINVLIALLDEAHVHHQRARAWLHSNIDQGWASCPITQNGCVRIMSQPAYPKPVPPSEVMARLRAAVDTEHHRFWPDDFSLLDTRLVDARRIHGPRQLTDIYLLALAVRHQGRFVSFDGGIAISAVAAAEPRHLVAL
ncbi:MAG TPA: VapC toxin family PIN domain ribonuclease [Xanthomonadaceae bacterium]|nr:VapC toxin family PIN domain ribonuclease [Xanthomonadaceae bacterium]